MIRNSSVIIRATFPRAFGVDDTARSPDGWRAKGPKYAHPIPTAESAGILEFVECARSYGCHGATASKWTIRLTADLLLFRALVINDEVTLQRKRKDPNQRISGGPESCLFTELLFVANEPNGTPACQAPNKAILEGYCWFGISGYQRRIGNRLE